MTISSTTKILNVWNFIAFPKTMNFCYGCVMEKVMFLYVWSSWSLPPPPPPPEKEVMLPIQFLYCIRTLDFRGQQLIFSQLQRQNFGIFYQPHLEGWWLFSLKISLCCCSSNLVQCNVRTIQSQITWNNGMRKIGGSNAGNPRPSDALCPALQLWLKTVLC